MSQDNEMKLDDQTLDRALAIVHWSDQYREGGNHPNSSFRRCGLCDRLRESMLDPAYMPEAPFEGPFDDE